jgi:hypothetical protein
MAETGKPHRKPDGSRRLAFPKRCRIDGGHEYIPAERSSMKPPKYVKRNLRLQLSIRKELADLDTKLISDILDWMRLHRSIDLNICHWSNNGILPTDIVARQDPIREGSIQWALLDGRAGYGVA